MLFGRSFSAKKEPLLTENFLLKNLAESAVNPPFQKVCHFDPGIIAPSRAKIVIFALNEVLNGTNRA